MAVPTTTQTATIQISDAGPWELDIKAGDASWIDLYVKDGTIQATRNVHYTVDLLTDGIIITKLAAMATLLTDNTVTDGLAVVVRNTPAISDFTAEDAAIRRKVRDALDKVYMAVQDVAAIARSAIRMPFGSVGVSLPDKTVRGGRLLGFNAAGTALELYPILNDIDINDTMLAQSIPVMRTLTAVAYPATKVFLASYAADSGAGGGLFYHDAADVVSPDNSSTIIVDASGRRWKRANTDDQVIALSVFGAKGDGTTDDTAAIQRAFDYAAVLCTDLGYTQSRRVSLTGGGRRYKISNRVTLSGSTISLRDAQFVADAASGNWNDGNSMLKVQGESHVLSALEFDCNMIANGIEHAGQNVVYQNVDIEAFGLNDNRYGFGSFTGGPVYAFHLTCTGRPKFLGIAQADRKGICIKLVDNGDSKFIGCVASFARCCLLNQDVANNKFTECHFFNGSGEDGTVHNNTIIIENRNATSIFNACYMDNGYIDLYDQDAVINGCFFLYSTLKTTLSARVRLWASKVNDTLGRLQISNNFVNNQAIPFYSFQATGGNSWAASVNQTHMADPQRDIFTFYKEQTFISADSANQNVAKFVSNATIARLRLASKNSVLNGEPCIETSGSDISMGLLGSMFVKMTSAGKWLFGAASVAAGATANGGSIETSDGITFPAVAVPKSDVHTLDAYEEGSWSPTISFVTPGDLAVTYGTRIGRYTRIGNRIFYQIQITTTSFTWTTAAGVFRITNMPYQGLAASGAPVAAVAIRGYTKANYTMVAGSMQGGTTNMQLVASGSGQVPAALVAADFPSGGTLEIQISGHYEIAG